MKNESNLAVAEAYYKAVNEKNLEEVAQYLHDKVQFLSPFAQKDGKEGVLEALKGFMQSFDTISIRSKFEAANQVMLAYDVIFPEPIGAIRSAVLMTFKDNLIFKIELFFDTRQFERK